MAVAVVFDLEGATLEHYDEMMRKMGYEGETTCAPGALFHWATQTGDGIRVTDVWESAEQYQRFAEEQIGPATAEIGIPAPTVTVLEVHNHLTGPA